MAFFIYTCIDAKTGREVSGRIEEASTDEAISALKRKGLHPVSLAEGTTAAERLPSTGDGSAPGRAGSDNHALPRRPRLERKELTRFTRQLASLLKAGLPLLRGLEVLARQSGRSRTGLVVRAVAESVRGGAALSAAMSAQPRAFPSIYVAMVRAGEAGGVLEVVLERLGLFLEKSDRIRGRIRAAMVYPAMIALVAGGVVTALMMFVVPKFEAVFVSLLKGQPLPGLTAAVLAAGRFLQAHTYAALAAPVLTIAVYMAIVRLPAVRRWRDRVVLRLPGIGGLATKSAVAGFSRTLGTLLAAGVPILAALRITKETGGNSWVAGAISMVHDRVEAGESFAAPLAATKVFPELVPSMVEVGEETGTLPEMLGRIADVYDEEVDATVAGLTALIEPLTIAVMAVVVGTIVISMFLPIVRIIQTLA